MIIKNISCEQFAGVRNKDVALSDGLNIIVGPNEAGKSTLVDLMYQMLYQDVKVSEKSGFRSLYFPKTTGAVQGDCVDGTLVFETSAGQYVLKKEWQSSGTCKLYMPDNSVIVDNAVINSVLAQVLEYGKSVYDEMVFASQKRVMTVLQALFQNSASHKVDTKTRDKLAATVKKAVMETGGISIDEMQDRLSGILKRYDERWDFDADMPERDSKGKMRGIGDKWDCAKTTTDTDKATILRAWYAMKEIEDAQCRAREAEQRVDEANSRLDAAKHQKKKASDQRRSFGQIWSVLKSRQSIVKLQENAQREKGNLERDAETWPEATQKRTRAEELRKAQEQAACKSLFDTVSDLKDQLEEKYGKLQQMGEITEKDVSQVGKLEREIAGLEAQLRGLDLSASIRQMGEITPVVRSVSTGEEIDFPDGNFAITEAVDIIVPGVMELRLTPNGVDVDAVSSELAEKRKKYLEILERHGVKSIEGLQRKQSNYASIKSEAEGLQQEIEHKLIATDWDTLQAEYHELPEITADADAVFKEIWDFCGSYSLDVFIDQQNYILGKLEEKYGTQEKLAELIQEKAEEIEEYRAQLDSIAEIPEEYQNIDDVDSYAEQLSKAEDECDDEIGKYSRELSDAEHDLGKHTAEEYADSLEEATRIFEEQKQMYARWKHISEVVDAVKKVMFDNPMQDIEERFGEYLSLLSAGNIAVNEMDEHMNTQLTSGHNRLTYENLSEGTRETVSLAFRLAMLQHLYPNGGGLAVFDDPFTDMDPVRTEQACRLIQKFAENKNQVIFVTCDDKYTSMLSGTVVKME